MLQNTCLVKLNTRILKNFAIKLPPNSALREVILSEKDEISPEEAVLKIEIWNRLLEIDLKKLF